MQGESDQVRRLEDPDSRLERAFEEEFLRGRGVEPGRLNELPQEELKSLLNEASVYASSRLAEVRCRARFVHELHGDR